MRYSKFDIKMIAYSNTNWNILFHNPDIPWNGNYNCPSKEIKTTLTEQ